MQNVWKWLLCPADLRLCLTDFFPFRDKHFSLINIKYSQDVKNVIRVNDIVFGVCVNVCVCVCKVTRAKEKDGMINRMFSSSPLLHVYFSGWVAYGKGKKATSFTNRPGGDGHGHCNELQ